MTGGHYGGGKTGKKLPHHVFKCNDPKNEEWYTSFAAAFGDDYRFLAYNSACKRKSDLVNFFKTLSQDAGKTLAKVDEFVQGLHKLETEGKTKNAKVPLRCPLAGTWKVECENLSSTSGTAHWINDELVDGEVFSLSPSML